MKALATQPLREVAHFYISLYIRLSKSEGWRQLIYLGHWCRQLHIMTGWWAQAPPTVPPHSCEEFLPRYNQNDPCVECTGSVCQSTYEKKQQRRKRAESVNIIIMPNQLDFRWEKSPVNHVNPWKSATYQSTRMNSSKAPGNTKSSLAIPHRRPNTTIPGILQVDDPKYSDDVN